MSQGRKLHLLSFDLRVNEFTVFMVCWGRELKRSKMIDDGDGLHHFTGVPFLGWKLSKDYGVVYPSSTSWAGYTTCKQFVRSIFLLFTCAPSKVTADDEDSSKKKPRASSAPSKNKTIGTPVEEQRVMSNEKQTFTLQRIIDLTW